MLKTILRVMCCMTLASGFAACAASEEPESDGLASDGSNSSETDGEENVGEAEEHLDFVADVEDAVAGLLSGVSLDPSKSHAKYCCRVKCTNTKSHRVFYTQPWLCGPGYGQSHCEQHHNSDVESTSICQ